MLSAKNPINVRLDEVYITSSLRKKLLAIIIYSTLKFHKDITNTYVKKISKNLNALC